MKKILLTGATGFLGSHIVERLVQRGDSVACLVRDIKKLSRLEPMREKVKLIPLCQLEPEMEAFQADTVIHTACAYARGNSTFQDILNANLLFPLRVMEVCRKYEGIRWINTDTCLPMYLNTYALSKKQFRQWGKYYAEKNELQFINLQLEHFYGPDAPKNQFLSWAVEKMKKNEPLELTAGTQKRDFVYVGDVVCVYEAILNKKIENAYIDIPVGTGTAPTVREVVEYLKECTCSSSELRFGACPLRKGEPDSCCDTSVLKSLGVMPFTQWKDGMRQYLIEYANQEKNIKREVHERFRPQAQFNA